MENGGVSVAVNSPVEGKGPLCRTPDRNPAIDDCQQRRSLVPGEIIRLFTRSSRAEHQQSTSEPERLEHIKYTLVKQGATYVYDDIPESRVLLHRTIRLEWPVPWLLWDRHRGVHSKWYHFVGMVISSRSPPLRPETTTSGSILDSMLDNLHSGSGINQWKLS